MLTDAPDVGEGVICTKVFENGTLLCDYNGLLLEGDMTLAQALRGESLVRYEAVRSKVSQSQDK